VKLPTPCEALSALRPVQLLGGEQTLMAVTADGKVYATGTAVSSSRKCYCVIFIATKYGQL
jgi:alpha-tubulin suppressor-like RCC1 family protein